MQNESNIPKGGTQAPDPTGKKCTEVVNKLVQGGNPKSNWFAVCIICNSNGETNIAVKAVDTLTAQDVLCRVQPMIDQLWAHANSN